MFTQHEIGCYADGALGHDHVREQLAALLCRLYRHHPRGGDGSEWSEVKPIVEALQKPMSDDGEEEYEAIEWLNKQCYDDTYFDLSDGSLMLMAQEGGG